jgi:dihydrodipicolinate synthase/N-acetylneuraminate lyase
MNTSPLPKPLCGIVPPMITPLKAQDALDPGALERVIEHLLAGGVHGVFVLGTTGEGPALSDRLRREVAERACRQVAGRVPVLLSVIHAAFPEAVSLARHAADCGAQAVVVSAPYAMREAQADLRDYLSHLAAASPLPVFLYHMPPLTRTAFELETVAWAIDQPRIVGMKDSSGDLAYFGKVCGLLPRRPEWTLLAGPEELLPETMALGGHGGVCGGANIFPRLYVSLYEAIRDRNLPRVRALQAKVLEVADGLYRWGNHPATGIKAIKCAVSCLGLCDDLMAEPFVRLGAGERARVERFVAAFRMAA